VARAFTIFCCGTGSNSFDFSNPAYFDGELVTTLARLHGGMEFVDWVILDGPGSGGFQTDQLWAESFKGMLGEKRGTLFGEGWEQNADAAVAYVKGVASYTGPDKLSKEKREKLVEAFMQQNGVQIDDMVTEKGQTKPSEFWFFKKTRTRNLIGSKIEERGVITPQMLQQKKAEIFRSKPVGPTEKGGKGVRQERVADPITTVVLVGWSRGGVTCHMIANRLAKELPDVHVNIFALDPVPGLGQFADHRCELGPNVKSYVGIFARHELSWGFSPIVPKTAPSTKKVIFSIWGRHATMVGNAATDGSGKDPKRCPEIGTIVRDLAEKTVQSWGVPLTKTKSLSDIDILKKYDQVIKDRALYLEMRNAAYTVRQRSNKGVTSSDVRDVGISAKESKWFDEVEGLASFEPFVNAHHFAIALRCARKGELELAKLSADSLTRRVAGHLGAVLPNCI
jgi:hypothetical protein